MFRVTNSDISQRHGIYLGRNPKNGLLINLDLFDKKLTSPHLAVLGTTGAGKSVTIKAINGRSAILNIKEAIIDLEGEYRKEVEDMLGGRIISIKQGVESGINLFDIEIDEYENKIDILTKVAEIRAIIGGIIRKYMGRQLNAKEMADIEDSVIEIYKEKGINQNVESIYEKSGGKVNGKITFEKIKKRMPTLSDFHRILKTKQNSKELSQILSNFLKGKSLGMFDCQSQLSTNELIVDFDISNITDEVTKFYATLVITAWITNKYMSKKEKQNKSVTIDEGWHFFKYEETANFIENLARRARKKRCFTNIAEHNSFMN